MYCLEYLLIEYGDLEISTPVSFPTREEAHAEMCSRIASVLGVTAEDVTESYLDGVKLDADTCVTEFNAWAEHNGRSFDWRIFTRNDAGEYT